MCYIRLIDSLCKDNTSQGHEDIDQCFSQQAALLSRHEFSNPQEVIQLMDSTFRPDDVAEQERKRARVSKVDAFAYKLDQIADWKSWHAVLGIRLKGLRIFGLTYGVWFVGLGRFVFDMFGFSLVAAHGFRICGTTTVLSEAGC